MKTFFVFLFYLFALNAQAQLFSFENDWFSNEGFFDATAIKNREIAAIHIWDSEKKDGKQFKSEKSFLHYEFNREGKLKASYKAIPLKNKIDTATYLFYYNQKDQLYKQSEQQGPFYFIYYYFYNLRGLEKEIKVDVANNSLDTAYLHYFEQLITENTSRLTTLNAIRKPFLYVDKVFNAEGQLINKKQAYRGNQAYSEISYDYANGELQQIVETSANSKKKKTVQLERKDELLDLISIFVEGELSKKYAFTYAENGLPKAIIERDVIEKKIKIYRLNYLFYDD